MTDQNRVEHQRIGIGLVGAGWMGSEHSQAYRRIPEVFPESGLRPELVNVADSVQNIAESTAARWGYRRWSTDWRTVIADPEVDVVDITGPNGLHREVALAAAAAGKHVSCEKPLGRNAVDATDMAAAVSAAGVASNCNFEFRYNPALQHVRELVDRGRLGQLTHVRGLYLCDYAWTRDGVFSWRFDEQIAGWGALGDIGSHCVDALEMLAGPVAQVVGLQSRFVEKHLVPVDAGVPQAPGAGQFARADKQSSSLAQVTNEDYGCAILRFDSGAVGTLEVSRATAGFKDSLQIAVHGTDGACRWDSERMNELEVYLGSDAPSDEGFRRVLMGPLHPWYGRFCPGAGSGLGWHDMNVISLYLFLRSVVLSEPTETDFARGAHVARVLEAVQQSSSQGSWIAIPAQAGVGVAIRP